jgi:hypothetical protein
MRKHFISQNCFLYFFINTIIVSWRLVIWRHRLENFTQRTAAATPSKVIYNIGRLYDDWKYEPNASHILITVTTMVIQWFMLIVIQTLTIIINSVFIDEKRRKSQLCYNTFAGLYWLESQDADSFTATKRVQNGTQTVNTTSIINHNQTITDNYVRY